MRKIPREGSSKSLAHLWLMPVVFSGSAGFCYGGVMGICYLAGLMGAGSFASFGETRKTLIVIPMLFASIPVGFIFANCVIWMIPASRAFFIGEAKGRSGKSFRRSQTELMKMAIFVVPPMFAFALGVALWGW